MTDIQTRTQKTKILIFPYFSLYFLTDLELSDRTKKIWMDRKFQDLLENGPTSDRYPNPEQKKKNYFQFSIFFFICLRRSYTYRPFCPKLPKKMIKNIIIIKFFKYIVNITYFE